MKHSLNLYALADHIHDFADPIRQNVLTSEYESHDLDATQFGFSARLYSVPQVPKEPSWANFLRQAFPAFNATPTVMNRVALILRIPDGERAFFAVTFGSGRFLLRADAYHRQYGLRVALNAIYEGDQLKLTPSARLRQVKSMRVDRNTIHANQQSNRDAAIQDFGLDLGSDLIGAVVGSPGDREKWGARVSGSDAVRTQLVESFGGGNGRPGILALCRQLSAARNSNDYKVRFDCIDELQPIPTGETADLEQSVIQLLMQSPDDIGLAPPSLIDFDRTTQFRFSLDSTRTFDDLQLSDFLGLAAENDVELTLEELKLQRVHALDESQNGVIEWSLFETLDLEFIHGNRTVLLVGGDFWSVAHDLIDELNEFVDKLPESSADMPSSRIKDGKEENEGAYNARAANEKGHALLDKKTVKLSTRADAVEVCDVLTPSRQFVHVKRKFSSSSLSHLFGQGAVSADLFARSTEYRDLTRTKLDASFKDLVPTTRPDTAAYEVVYGIIGRWKGAPASERLPFFSKINLRRHTEDLRALGYRVTLKKIELEKWP